MQELVISGTRQHSPSTSRLPAPVLFAARSGRPPARRPFRLCATGCGHRVGVLEGEAEDKTLVVIRVSNPLHATVISRKGGADLTQRGLDVVAGMPVYYLGVPDTTALSREFELGRATTESGEKLRRSAALRRRCRPSRRGLVRGH